MKIKQSLKVLTKKDEDCSRRILDVMTKRHYPTFGIVQIFDIMKKEGFSQDNIIKALALMGQGGLIQIDKNITDHVSTQTITLLDDDGQPIKHTMIACYPDDPCFGVIYYDPSSIIKDCKKRITCWDHIDTQVEQTKLIIDPTCKKCFEESAQRICLEHKQSLPFCELCRMRAKDNIEQAKIEGFEVVTDKILKNHYKEYWAN